MEIIQHTYDRFARIPNETVDDSDNLDIPAIGLLAIFLRHRSGWDITLERIGKKYGHGRKAMATMMGQLQVARYVAKLRVQDAANGQWATKLIVSGVPLDWADIDAVMDDLLDRRSVQDVQYIEPTEAATTRSATRGSKGRRSSPTAPSPDCPLLAQSGAQASDLRKLEKPQVGADCSLQGQSDNGAVPKKTVSEGVNALTPSEKTLSQKTTQEAGPPGPGERDPATPQDPIGVLPEDKRRLTATIADEAGVSPAQVHDVIDFWCDHVMHHFKRQPSLDEYANEVEVVARELSMGASVKTLVARLRKRFAALPQPA